MRAALIGLRNSAHSLVKLMNPVRRPAVIVSSYTHPEYAVSMAAVFELIGATALLLRGTEGEVVADARRLPQMDGLRARRARRAAGRPQGTLTDLPELPRKSTPRTTAAYIRDVLQEHGRPESVALQVEHILRLASRHEHRQSHPGRRRPRRPGTADAQGLKAIQAATVLLVDDLVSRGRGACAAARASSRSASAAAARARRRPSSRS